MRAAASRAAWAAISSATFGAAPYAELQRVKQWLAAQPEHQRMRAYLNDPDPYTP